ncbi:MULTISPECIES: histidine phosphatase family protein [unclassified Luteococcus]|uniref:histidine phosphatase family protein n=1 Tax=unclassified Luteococcus TaxID=2639923 RepID=UPI00313E413C
MSTSILHSTAPATRLVLLRHGQTDWNLAGRFQGQLDVGMNDVGMAQARAAAPHIASLRPDVLVSSDLSRAFETARAVSEVTGLEIIPEPRVQEINVGSWGGLTGAEMAERDPHFADALLSGRDFRRSPEGETADEVGTRMRLALTDLAGQHVGRTVVVVSHGLAIRMACGYLLGWEFAHTWQLGPMGNCGWSVLVRTADRPWRLECYNRIAPA